MPNHFHLLLTPLNITLERAVQLVKGGFSCRVRKDLGLNVAVWYREYVDHRIRDAGDYARHLDYINQNPIRARIAISPDKYPYSSACKGTELDSCPQRLEAVNR